MLSFDVYPPEIYHESDVDTVPYEWRTDIELGDQRWAVEEEIIVRRKEQEIAVSYRHFRNEDGLRVDGPTYTIKHHYVLSHEWSPLLYAAGFEDWFFWGDFAHAEPDEDSELFVCWATPSRIVLPKQAVGLSDTAWCFFPLALSMVDDARRQENANERIRSRPVGHLVR